MESILERFDKLLLFFVTYTVIFLMFFKTLTYTLPFILAFIFAFILQVPTNFLINKFNFKNSLASLTTTIMFFTILLSLLTWTTITLTSETITLGKNVQNYITNIFFNLGSLGNKLNILLNNFDPTLSYTLKNISTKLLSNLGNLGLSLSGKLLSILLNLLTSIPYAVMVITFTLLCTYFFTKDFTSIKNKILNLIPSKNRYRISYILSEIKVMLTKYLMCSLLLIFITFVETLILFMIFKVKYTVMLSVICGIVDIVPILGIGCIYIPLAIFYLFSKNYFAAIGILLGYSIIVITRNILEPKIVSSSLGVNPVIVLTAIFIGLKANGILGMFFCIFLVTLYNMFIKLNIL